MQQQLMLPQMQPLLFILAKEHPDQGSLSSCPRGSSASSCVIQPHHSRHKGKQVFIGEVHTNAYRSSADGEVHHPSTEDLSPAKSWNACHMRSRGQRFFWHPSTGEDQKSVWSPKGIIKETNLYFHWYSRCTLALFILNTNYFISSRMTV